MNPFERIDHVQLAMPSGEEQKARDFYAGILGMAEVEKPAELRARGGAWFRSDDVIIHLGVEPEFRPARKAHPALVCRDFSVLLQTLTAAGYAVTPDPLLIDRRARCYVHDPFGNRIELIEGPSNT